MVPKRETELFRKQMEKAVLRETRDASELARLYSQRKVQFNEFKHTEQSLVHNCSVSFCSRNSVDEKFAHPEDLGTIDLALRHSAKEIAKDREVKFVETLNLMRRKGVVVVTAVQSPFSNKVDGDVGAVKVS